MLRIYFLQQWFNLSDPQAEYAIYVSESMRRFARVELGDEVVPDESTILRFRHLLEQHGLTHAIFDAVADLLEERRLLLRSGTIVDATIIAAPSSTKNASASRDPEMKQTRKGRNWHFGMKLHIGADKRGIVHTVRATAASVADITQLPDLLHGQERGRRRLFLVFAVAPNLIAAEKTSPKLAESPVRSILRGHKQCEIGRAGAYFDGFWPNCKQRRTLWRSGVDSNPRYREVFYGRELGAGLAHYSARQKASVLERICSSGIRQRNSRLSGRSALGRCVVDASLTQSESSTDKAGLLGEFKRRAGFAAA